MEEEGKAKGKRVVANIIDEIMVSIISTIITLIFSFDKLFNSFNATSDTTSGEELMSAMSFTAIIAAVTTIILTFVWFTVIPMFNKNRASIGKLMIGLKVIREDDQAPTFKNMLIRNIRLWLSILTEGVGMLVFIESISAAMTIVSVLVSIVYYVIFIYVLVCVCSGKRSFHDNLARTIVVDKMYDPNLKNYETIEEIKEWADVKGFEKKEFDIEYKENVEEDSDVEDKNPNDKGYWD